MWFLSILCLISFPLHSVLATLNLLQFPQHNMLLLSAIPTLSLSPAQLLLVLHDSQDITSSRKPSLILQAINELPQHAILPSIRIHFTVKYICQFICLSPPFECELFQDSYFILLNSAFLA